MIEVRDDVYEVIRKNIKHYRKLKGLTQEEFAEEMNLSYDYIRQVESKKALKHFSISSMQTAADVLGVELYKLFKDDNFDEE